jgi:MYXO-CTERM domain-containing protein
LKRTRTWRVMAAAAAMSAITMTIGGPALAQSPQDLPVLGELLRASDGSPDLDDLDGLPTDRLADLLAELGLPEGTPLDELLAVIRDTVGANAAADADVAELATGGSAATPEASGGGFVGYAKASGTTICVGLPAELREGLADLLDGLGIAGACEEVNTDGIRIDLAQTQADLQRAALGDDVSSRAKGLITNLLLGSAAADEPGACTGGPTKVAVPDEATPLITFTLLGVDCEESDARAFADVQIAGVDIRLGNLIELGAPAEFRTGMQEAVTQLNGQLLAPLSEGICAATDPAFEGVLGDGTLCEDDEPFLQLTNPLDVDVPLVALELITASSEVTHDDGTVTATASATLTGLNVLGMGCLGGDGTAPYTFTSTASTDGETATRSATAPDLQLRLCQQDQSLLRTLMSSDIPLGDIAALEQVLQDSELEPLFDGFDQLLDALQTRMLTQGKAYTNPVDHAGTSAGTTPFAVVASLPLSGLPGLEDSPLADLGVAVIGNETAVGVNATPVVVPAGAPPQAAPTPSEPLPHTGAGLAGILGLGALGAAAALRRRDR